jgi:hypothetical protein
MIEVTGREPCNCDFIAGVRLSKRPRVTSLMSGASPGDVICREHDVCAMRVEVKPIQTPPDAKMSTISSEPADRCHRKEKQDSYHELINLFPFAIPLK